MSDKPQLPPPQWHRLPRLSRSEIVDSSSPATINGRKEALPVSREFEFEVADPQCAQPVNNPGRFDAEIGSCVVHGKIPPNIDGTFYRVVIDYIYTNRNRKDIWINGDGAVNAWRISNGVVDYKQKFVRTPRFIHERAVRQPLWGTYRNPYAGDPRVFDEVQSTGNTHVQWWQKKLLVLKEDSPPIVLDPDTLDTIGVYTFEGQLRSKTFCAHPKTDVSTGEMLGFGMEASGIGANELAYYRFSKEGKVLDECWIKTPVVSWTHDMAATDNYVVFGMTPHQFDLEHMKKDNGTHFRRNPFLPNHFGILPRRNPKPDDAKWFTSLKNHYWGHVCNHFEDADGIIYIDLFLHDTDALRAFPTKHPELETQDGPPPVGKFVRFKIDPEAEPGELELPTIISDVPGELARCDDRYTTKPYTHAYGCGLPGPNGFGGILHIDIDGGLTEVWHAGPEQTVGEPCFVPRTPDSPEGDGYLVVSCRDHKTTLGNLVILDAQNITAGPISVVQLPFRIREGVHGNWVPASDFAVRKPLVDYAGVTPEILDEFGTGAPIPFEDLNARPVDRGR
ncbi:Lignostilbene dioxygenase [Colletotrichum higginsianum IMI 349063]|uniref:Lignostilbene dioxygenase n=1 Tax=Colletotrichum higginsianum (strain IMI 349063) TaxID=759273 RepID=A0A1B7Y0C8_COLHI|nr:Lignostilbene dioxygenase [Colletotrichum higginsianum IMI 349063]OBR05468.1 Lignostilbene dioxygenase [Colletotrichum higginsianum IMI 349063]